MDAQLCLSLLRQVRDVVFATVDERRRPQARIIDVMLAEAEKLYFCTARGKAFYQQLLDNPYVAVTGMNEAFQMVRLQGEAVRLPEQRKWIDRIFAENPMMNDVYPGDSRYVLEAFCIADGQLEFFDLSETPVFRQCFSIGACQPLRTGFLIGARCVGCGKCAAVCPQKCIATGKPYAIRQEHCLHCGICREICPAHAVVRREDGV